MSTDIDRLFRHNPRLSEDVSKEKINIDIADAEEDFNKILSGLMRNYPMFYFELDLEKSINSDQLYPTCRIRVGLKKISGI